MSYVQDNLMPNERVLFSARISRAIFLPAVVFFLGGIVFMILAFGATNQQNSNGSALAGGGLCVGGIFLLAAFIYTIQAFIILATTEFAVTNRRLIAKSGFIRRHTLEMLLQKIESVAVNQNVLARLFNFGVVTVTGTGGTKERFTAISNPLAVRKVINQIIEESSQEHGPQPGAAYPGGSDRPAGR